MGSKWPVLKFKDLYLTPSRNGLTKPKAVRGTGYKYINMGEIFSYGRMLNIPCDRVELTEKEKQTSLLMRGDLLFARQSLVLSGAGKCSIFLGDDEDVTFDSHLIRVRLNTELINPEYLYYYFLSPQGRKNISTIVEQGAGQAGVRGSDLENLDVPVPPKKYQDNLVALINDFDTKCECNNTINQTLEQMAQTLFKSWFVDFDPVIDNALDAGNDIPDTLQERAEQRHLLRVKADFNQLPAETRALFPSEFEETELGWVPKGWSYCFVKDIADINSESWNAKNSPETLEYLDLSNAKDGSIISTELYTFDDAPSRARRVLRKNDTVFGLVRPANKSFAYIDRDGLTGSTGFAVIRSKENCYKNYLYLCITDADVVDEFARIADGGAYPAIKNEDIADLQIIKPCKNLLTTFDLLASELRDKMAVNSTNNQTLTEIRDSLLPKLISGELELDALPEAPELVEAL